VAQSKGFHKYMDKPAADCRILAGMNGKGKFIAEAYFIA
jgi:hypothetical protein